MAKSAIQSRPEPRKLPGILLLWAVVLAVLVGGLYWANRPAPNSKAPAGSAAAMHYETGLKLAREGNLTGAANEWQTAIGLEPGYDLPYLALARMDEQKGDYLGAVRELDALQRGNPHVQHIICRQAGLYLKADRYETALRVARAAVQSEPDCPQAHTMLGAVLAKAGDWAGWKSC